jgi:hypothetical protein
MADRKKPTGKGAKRRNLRRAAAVGAGLVTLAEAVVVGRRRGSMFAVRTVVRCHDGHLFTTVWIPGASVKALRLGPWRVQRCPVGPHWSLVTPVKLRELSDEQRELAKQTSDGLVP